MHSRASLFAFLSAAVLTFGVLAPCAAQPPASKGSGAAARSYDAIVMGDHPIAYWRLDETHGSVAHDASGHHHDGAIGSRVNLGAAPIVRGTRASMEFSGANKSVGAQDVRIPGSKAFELTNSLTVEAWIFPYDIGVFGKNNGEITLVAYGRDDNPDNQHCRYALELDAPSKVLHFPTVVNGKSLDPPRITGLHSLLARIAYQFAGAERGIRELYAAPGSVGVSPATHQPYYLVGTYDGTSLRFYINGELNNVMHVQGQIEGYQDPRISGVGIGGEFINTNPVFHGRIGEAAIYDRPLTPEQIRRHFDAGKRD